MGSRVTLKRMLEQNKVPRGEMTWPWEKGLTFCQSSDFERLEKPYLRARLPKDLPIARENPPQKKNNSTEFVI